MSQTKRTDHVFQIRIALLDLGELSVQKFYIDCAQIQIKPMLKRSKLLFGFISMIGVALLLFFFICFYLLNTWSVEILTIKALIPEPSLGYFMTISIIAGTVFLAVGVLGLGKQYAGNHSRLFAVLAVILVPMFVFSSLVSLTFILEFPPERKLTITNIMLDSTSPLAFSFTAKSFCSFDIYFDKVFIKDRNQTIVASVNSEWVEVEGSTGNPYSSMKFIGKLSPGSEETFTFCFNTALPAGSYNFWISSWDRGGFKSFSFIVP